ncbi:OmpA family protein [Bacteroidota bacterium]
MKRIIILVIISLNLVCKLSSQEEINLKEIFQEAEYYILYEDFPEALALYQRLANNDFVNAYINHRIGECYLHISGQKHKAIPYLEEASKDISDDIKEGSFKETHAPIRTLFYLGDAYQVNNQLDKAIETYQKFKEALEVQDIYNIDYVDQQIQACINAKELMANPLKVRKVNAGNIINDEFSNINAVVSSDENSMVYISKLKFYDAVLYSEKVRGDWSAPININSDIQSDGEYYPCYLSAKNKSLILFKYDNFSGDIYLSEFKEGKWQLPKKLNKHINSKSFETHATLSADGKTIYFVSDRKEGFGGLDIYKSTFDDAINDWGIAVNLGPEINTPFDEETPQISEDGKTLYYSSQGHYNMGGFDIFYANLIEENQWSTPINIGYPINTTDDEIFFYPVKNGQYAYLSTCDKAGFGQKDIYRIEFFTAGHPFLINVRGTVSLQDNQTDFIKSNFHVDILDSAKVEVIKQLYLDENTGEFTAELLPGSYRFIFKSKEYKQKVKTVIIPENYSRDELVFNVELIPLSVTTGEYVTIKSIYFGFDDYSLSKESKIELERLYNLMIKYSSLKIEIIGHTDSKGSADYNKKLSFKRAESVINYLINKGIDQTRFMAKGAGMDQPLAVNINPDGSDNPVGRKFNRRVEMKILKSDDKIILTEEHNIPAHLVSKDFSYCILLTKEKEELPKNYFTKFEELKDFKIKKHKNKVVIYTLGDCNDKSELIKIFNVVLELGFDDAEIISNYDLKNLLQ